MTDSDKSIDAIFSDDAQGMSASYWSQQYHIAKWALSESDRLHKQSIEAAESRAAQAEADLSVVLERERVELIEWAERVEEQAKLRKQAEAERDEARQQYQALMQSAMIIERERDDYGRKYSALRQATQQREENLRRWCETLQASADTTARELEQAQERIKQLERETAYFQSTDFAADKHLAQFERTAPVDWREDEADETPLGQQLDGGGDEVEP